MTLSPRWTTERGVLWSLDLSAPDLPMIQPRVPTTFAELRPDEIAQLAPAIGPGGFDTVHERLRAGRRCFVACVDGHLATYGWVSYDEERVGEMERSFRFPPCEVYVWDCSTLPQYQGQRLYSALLSYIAHRLRGEGVRRAWIGAGVANQPSTRGIANAGFRPVASGFYARILAAHIMWVSGVPGAPKELVTASRRIMVTGREVALGPLAVGVG
jgi:GNAT superfamily N-acetyltransferase